MTDTPDRGGRRGVARALGVALMVALAACGAEGDAADTRTTSMDLLNSRPDDGSRPAASRVPDAEPGVAPGQERPIDVASLGFDRGDSTAVVRVVEMSDYSCGVCRQFHESVWPELQAEFIDTGLIQWKFLPFVSGQFANSPVASEGAECSLEQGAETFIEHNRILWAEQGSWKNEADPAAVVRATAQRAGADMGEWDACMASDRRLQRIVDGTRLARQLGVRGTPTFFVVGYPPIQGLLPTETFRRVLAAAVEDARSVTGG